MKRMLFALFACTLVFVLMHDEVWAQATAQITGTVKDQSGAVLPGVEITVTQTNTEATRNAITNETGSFVLANLPLGPYRLEAALPGFRTYSQTGIVLQVNSSPVVNPVLEVGQVTEQIDVQANAALVETRNAGVGQVVENARILELPLNGRQLVDLIGLAGGAAPAPVANGGNRDPFASASFSVAGGMNTGLTYTLDGATHNNMQDNGYISLPFPDALQEFKVETSASGAQNGMKSAGSVNLVTKSGTNAFHGNLFEFVRNGMFNARNAFAVRRDTIKRNQFGGTLGGPIRQNKLFFFAGYQGTTIRQDPIDSISFVPTAAMVAGDFTDFASPACNGGRQINLRAPFVNNRVDPAQFSKPAVNLASKLPKTLDPCGKIIYGNPNRENGHQAIGRIDYQRSANHSVFGRYLLDSLVRPAAYDINKNPLSIGVWDDGLAQAFTIGDTYLFSANVVHSLRLTANRIAAGKFLPNGLDTAGVGVTDIGVKAFTWYPHSPQYSITGGFSISAQGGPTRTAIFGVTDDLSMLRGNHQFALGAMASAWWMNTYSQSALANFSFNGQTTGLGMADYFLGYAATFQHGAPLGQNKRSKYVGVYGADTWKINQKLTMSYGLRWEPYFPIINLDGSSKHFDEDALKKGIRSKRFTNTPPGVFFEGDPGIHGQQAMYDQWWNFSPRVGLAWDVSGDGRTSVRASVGTFYDFPHTYYLALGADAPFLPRYGLFDVNFENPWANWPGGDPLPVSYGKDVSRDVPWPLSSNVIALDYDTANLQVAQWNLTLQKQLGTSWLASASYLGSATTHLWSVEQLNPAIFLGLGPCTLNGVSYTTCSTTANTEQRRRLTLENPQTGQYFGDIPKISPGGTANYNGLIVSLQRRAARGVTVTANHTWSHCITDPQPGATAIGTRGNLGYTDNKRTRDRGNCSSASADRRHIFNLSAVAETPQFANRTLRAVASGWRFSPIFKILSGSYMSVTTTQDRALNGLSGQRVDQILVNPYGNKSVNNYLNPAAFALASLGRYGNIGAANIVGPGTWQFDAALARTFQFHERQKVEFRAEAFNVTNSFHMNNPTTVLNSNTFGQVTSAKDPRIMQFALKYFF